MRKIASLLLLCMMSNISHADCDWTQVKKNPDNTFTYPEALHLCVGKMVQDSKVKDAQIADLTKAITLKDLALTTSDQRATLWMNTSSDMENRLQKVDTLEKKNQWIYFALGAATVLGAGFMASRLLHP